MNASAPRIGIIGTGAMGRPVIDRLVVAGFDVAAYARRSEARDELLAAGVTTVESVGALAARSDIVILYVFTDEQVRAVAIDDGLIDSMAEGSIVAIHTTGSPATARELAQHARTRGVGVVDAAGSGGPADVAAGRLNLFLGGEPALVERCRPIFEAYASAVTHFGPLGAGQTVKLINNLLFGSHVQLALEASRLAATAGIDPVELARVLHTCSGQSFSLDLLASTGSAEKLVSGVGPYIHKDMVVARIVAKSIGASLGTIDAVIEPLLERTRPSGDD